MIGGAVGALQIEVMAERVRAENDLEVVFEPSPWNAARWLAADDPKKVTAFLESNRGAAAKDLDGAPVYLAKSAWDVGYMADRHPDIRFTKTKERA